VEECAAFPYGEHDDYVDSTTQAIMRIRQGGMVRHPEDYKEEPIVKGEIKYYGWSKNTKQNSSTRKRTRC